MHPEEPVSQPAASVRANNTPEVEPVAKWLGFRLPNFISCMGTRTLYLSQGPPAAKFIRLLVEGMHARHTLCLIHFSVTNEPPSTRTYVSPWWQQQRTKSFSCHWTNCLLGRFVQSFTLLAYAWKLAGHPRKRWDAEYCCCQEVMLVVYNIWYTVPMPAEKWSESFFMDRSDIARHSTRLQVRGCRQFLSEAESFRAETMGC